MASQLEFTSNRSINFGQIVDAMEQSLVEVQNVRLSPLLPLPARTRPDRPRRPQDRAHLARSKIATVIPDLETRHAALHAELEAERQLDAQLSAMAPEDVEFRESLLADSEEQECVLSPSLSASATLAYSSRD